MNLPVLLLLMKDEVSQIANVVIAYSFVITQLISGGLLLFFLPKLYSFDINYFLWHKVWVAYYI